MICLPKNGKNEANTEGNIMKNEMPSVFLDENLCFIRLPPNALEFFW
jgi:hypothetical protein